MMDDNEIYIRKWTRKVIALNECIKADVPIENSEELMITLLTELVAELPITDEEYVMWKNQFRFYGVEDSDVEDVLKRVREVMGKDYNK